MSCICIHFKKLYDKYKNNNEYDREKDHIYDLDHENEIHNLIDHPYDTDIELIRTSESESKCDNYQFTLSDDEYLSSEEYETTQEDEISNKKEESSDILEMIHDLENHIGNNYN